MLCGSVVEHQVNDNADAARVRLGHQLLEICIGAVFVIHGIVICDIVAVVAGRLMDGHKPDTGDPQVVIGGGVAVVEIVELLYKPLQVAHTVAIAIVEAAHEDLVEDGIVPPGHSASV
ncbi:MAG: hypothetical protein BWY63_01998 [Chloroflexi bacterium ADurb.Bin360]|nr:MAG: hypothetical protein BWY63_01998 [Chloroflexi bacterium ADurb.Bin360]